MDSRSGQFPKRIENVVEKGRELGIEVCLWFNPSYTDNYDDWLQDAKVLISLNRKYGIRTFKIDGLRIHNKLSEERVDSLLSTVSEALNHDVVLIWTLLQINDSVISTRTVLEIFFLKTDIPI